MSIEKVGIIGAGLAGLSCGYTLAKSGIEFRILEASERVGGRVMTYRHSTGETVELGAGYFHDFYGVTLSLLKELGLEQKIVNRKYHQMGFVKDGKLLDLREIDPDNSLSTSITNLKYSVADHCRKCNELLSIYSRNNKSFFETLSEYPYLLKAIHTPFTSSELYQSLDSATQELFVKPFLRKQLSSEAENISLMTAAAALGASNFTLKSLEGGMSLLPETLYSKIKHHVALEQRVTNVYREGKKWVLCSGNQEYVCDAVVATTPGIELTSFSKYQTDISYGHTNVFVIEGEKYPNYENSDILFSKDTNHKIVGITRYGKRLFKVQSFECKPHFEKFFQSYEVIKHQYWKYAIPQLLSNKVNPLEQLDENFYLAGDHWFPCIEMAITTGCKIAKAISLYKQCVNQT